MRTSAQSPLVSVLMPAYNHEAYVRPAVESILGQTHDNLELIVIDDASTDSTLDILRTFDDPRLRLRHHVENRGAHASLNEAMSIARGEYLAIINSDDIFPRERIARLLKVLRDSEGRSGLAFSDVEFIDATGASATGHAREAEYRKLVDICRSLPPRLRFFSGNPAVTTSNFFFSRALGERLGDFLPLRYTHDWDWLLRAAGVTDVTWQEEPLLKYRVHSANTLSEVDSWRHIHENSVVQSRALAELAGRAVAWRSAAFEICRALLTNTSFHPLPVLFYLLRHLMESGFPLQGRTCLELPDQAWLNQLRDLEWVPKELLHSIDRLSDLARTVASQARLLNERWESMQAMNGMIAQRDEVIAAQAVLVEERWRAMQEMDRIAAEREHVVAAQASMLEERYKTIQEMSAEIESLRAELTALRADR